MDKKIREAAENDIQNYQEKDWKGMEVLLDKHLPQKKRRRGIIVFFLLAALTATGYLLYDSVSTSRNTLAQEEEVTSPAPGNKTNSATTKPVEKTQPVSQEPTSNDTRTVLPSTPASATTNSNLSSGKKDLMKQPVVVSSTEINKNGRTLNLQKNQHPTNDIVVADKNIPSGIDNKQDNGNKNIAPTKDNQQTFPSTYPATVQNEKVITQQPGVPVAENKENKSEQVADVKKPAKKERSPKSFSNRFSLTASAGPDYSSVKFKYAGEVRLQYGVGLSYAINDRFSVRTGFYAGSKVYSADSNSYKTQYTGGGYSYKLYSIDADCYVFEVPVSLVYNFKTTKDHNWFASAGLSSYFMKKEDYLYTYISPSGTKSSRLWQYRNENKHPFSVLGFSAGYQRKFNDRFSLSAEPYIKLPLGGVGDGKVMLNSTGVLFTAAWKPFGKK